jgi:NitT/TauT family transport system ATP-binding protein
MTDPILETKDVQVAYDDRQGRVEAVGGISLSQHRGEFLCLVGPSACGKTSLLRILAGLIPPSSGRVYLEGQTVLGPTPRIGVLFQQNTLFPWLTVEQNVVFGLESLGETPERATSVAMELLQDVEMERFRHFFPDALSGGMVRRTMLARSLATQPKVLLLDEPLSSLDTVSREAMQLVIERVCLQRNISPILVTHDLDESLVIADRILLLTPAPARILREFIVGLPRPRIVDGTRCAGFTDVRNELGEIAHSMYR